MSLLSIRKKGYLYKLPVKGVVKKWNKRWFVLYANSIDGVVRMEYFDHEDCEVTEIGKRTIPLRDCMNASQRAGTKTRPYVFEFSTQLGHHVFSTDSQTDLDEWVVAIREAVKEDKRKMRKFKTQSLLVSKPPISSATQSEASGEAGADKTVKNTLYEPTLSGTYRVTLEQNDTARRLSLSSSYNLEITPVSITLIAANSGAQIAIWNYRQIKSYGKTSGKFNLETGKAAETGTGTFIFITSCSREIFGVVHRNIKRLRNAREKEATTRYEQTALMQKQTSATAVKQQPSSAKYSVGAPRAKPRSKQTVPRPTGEVAGRTTIGTYRRSKDLEEKQPYDEVTPDQEIDISELYAKVQKPKKKSIPDGAPGLPPRFYSVKQEESGTGLDVNPFLKHDSTSQAAARLPYGSTRDSRDSALLEEEGPSFTNPLADDLYPITSGVENPLSNIDDVDFNLDELDDKLFDAVDDMDLEDQVPDLGRKESPKQRPLAKPIAKPRKAHTTDRPMPAVAPRKKPVRRLSQQEFDKIWDDICSNLPDDTEFS